MLKNVVPIICGRLNMHIDLSDIDLIIEHTEKELTSMKPLCVLVI